MLLFPKSYYVEEIYDLNIKISEELSDPIAFVLIDYLTALRFI